MIVIAYVFPKYALWKSWLDHSIKIAVSENALTVNVWKCPKYLQNLHDRPFIMFFDHSEGGWFRKSLP